MASIVPWVHSHGSLSGIFDLQNSIKNKRKQKLRLWKHRWLCFDSNFSLPIHLKYNRKSFPRKKGIFHCLQNALLWISSTESHILWINFCHIMDQCKITQNSNSNNKFAFVRLNYAVHWLFYWWSTRFYNRNKEKTLKSPESIYFDRGAPLGFSDALHFKCYFYNSVFQDTWFSRLHVF